MATDYYTVLGLERSASDATIKSTFRALAKRLHPDLNPNNPGAEAAFKALNEAYTVLSDPLERERYNSANRWAGVPRGSSSSAIRGSGAAPRSAADAWGDYLREEASHERAAQRLREAAARGSSGLHTGGAAEDRHEGWEARRAARVAASEAASAARGASESGHYRAFAGQWRAKQSGSGGVWPALMFMAVVTTLAMQHTGSFTSQGARRKG